MTREAKGCAKVCKPDAGGCRGATSVSVWLALAWCVLPGCEGATADDGSKTAGDEAGRNSGPSAGSGGLSDTGGRAGTGGEASGGSDSGASAGTARPAEGSAGSAGQAEGSAGSAG